MQPHIQITEEITLPMSDTYAYNSASMDEVKLIAFAQKHGLDVDVTRRDSEQYPFQYSCNINGFQLRAISEVEYLAD